MIMRLFRCECKNCKKTFKAPCLTGDGYGEFLLLDDHGDMVYLNSFTDPVFDEVNAIFKSMVTKKDHNNVPLCLKLFSPVLSSICDLSPNNQIYRSRKPPCPTCKKSDFSHFGPTNPSETVEMNIPNATHNAWNKLSDAEKKQKIAEVIKKARSEKDD